MPKILVSVALNTAPEKKKHFSDHDFGNGFKMRMTTQELAFLHRFAREANRTSEDHKITIGLLDLGGTD